MNFQARHDLLVILAIRKVLQRVAVPREEKQRVTACNHFQIVQAQKEKVKRMCNDRHLARLQAFIINLNGWMKRGKSYTDNKNLSRKSEIGKPKETYIE